MNRISLLFSTGSRVGMNQLSRELKLTIQQILNVPQTRISVEYDRYMELNGEYYGDKDFINFLKREVNVSLEKPTLAVEWLPSSDTIAGIPLEVSKEYIPIFKEMYTGKSFRTACYNEAFANFCYMRWKLDSRNKKTKFATRMEMGWEPDREKLGDLSWLTQEQLKCKTAEFKLYWKDAGTHKRDWYTPLKEYLNRK